MGVNYSPSIINNNLFFSIDARNIKSYPGSGSSWFDLSGNSRNATLYNSPTFSSDQFQLDGVNDFMTTSNVTIAGDQTFSIWISVAGTNWLSGILTQHNFAATGNFGINCMNGTKLSVSIGYTDGTREYSGRQTSYTVVSNTIFNAVMVYNSLENKIYWYINGELDSTHSLTKSPKYTNYPICIGRWDAGYGDYYFNGKIYNGSIYNTALTASQVKKNFNALRGRFGL